MTRPARILVVAATARELAPAAGWTVLECGVGPVESAARTAAALASMRTAGAPATAGVAPVGLPDALVHVGIAGARRDAAIAPGTLVVGTASRYDDLGVGPEWAVSTLAPDARLVAAVCAAFPDARPAGIATVGRVGASRWRADAPAAAEHCPVEAMEGFAVLRAAHLAGVPAIEVRAIANEVEERDRARWHFDAAFAAITAATPRVVAAVREALCAN